MISTTRGRPAVLLLTATALAAGLLAAPTAHADNAPVQILVDGNDVLADNANGLTYKGLGLVSANSTLTHRDTAHGSHPSSA